jgi:hypothetical protein
MRKVSLFIGSAILPAVLSASLAVALPAHAEPTGAPPPETAAAQPALDTPPPHPRFQVTVSYLPMAYGKITSKIAGHTDTGDSAFASGVGLAASANIYKGFMVGIVPQAIWKAKVKADPMSGAATKFGTDTEYDLLLRLAYAYQIPGVATFYAEIMPGYSTLYPATADTAKGLVMVYGIGGELDMTKRIFANFGIGYQTGYQTETSTAFYRNKFVRVALGVGVRF